ncbi:MAG: septal ring lytic transglycosylase RlpA family protein [Candidatus Kapabacteria bacterium]|nr:septal ring lytic transglycosylase RlpA family protein [Candidatus Kapabacteria bacterium]
MNKTQKFTVGIKALLFLTTMLFVSSCTSSRRFSSDIMGSKPSRSVEVGQNYNKKDLTGKVIMGKASYYADKFHGRQTASGEIFNMNNMTCAHKTLSFGTRLLVKNLNNGKTVIVRVNDRGPFVGNRVIDLSKAAAQKLDMISSGVIDVEITILK